jgi:hypothetical protein
MGVLTTVFVAFISPWAFAVSMCRSGGGHIADLGSSCQAPGCDPVSLVSYIPWQLAAMNFVLLGIPIGFAVYSVILRTTGPLPPK